MSAPTVVQQPGYPPPGGHPPPQGDYPPPKGYSPPMAMAPMGQQQGWMPIPRGIPSCPPGLEYLTMVDQLFVKQQIDVLEAFTQFDTNNKYIVNNSVGQMIYFAAEDTDCCTRYCLSSCRPFDMKILDNGQNEVVHLYRPLAYCGCCFPRCLQKIHVFAPPGTLIGRVMETWSLCAPHFNIENANGDVVLKIRGPIGASGCCSDIEFKVMALDGETQVGKISKLFTGETIINADNFRITFPMDLDVNVKAVMLGACLLISFVYFDNSMWK